MKIRILGNNGPFPAANSACSSYLISSERTNILLDLGSASLANLMRFIKPEKIDVIILSHLHWDHITDIPVLNYYFNTIKKQGGNIPKVDLFLPNNPADIFSTIEEMESFNIKKICDGMTNIIGGIKVSMKVMKHPFESYAVKFEADGKSLVYSGDTAYNSDLVEFSTNCELLIADSFFLDLQLTSKSPHMSALECAKTAMEAGVKKLVLSHLNPLTKYTLYLQEAIKIFPDTIIAVTGDEEEV